jgi:hypothetical protein
MMRIAVVTERGQKNCFSNIPSDGLQFNALPPKLVRLRVEYGSAAGAAR